MDTITNLNQALETCFNYKNSLAKEIELENCSNLLFLLDNFVQKDFINPYALYLEVTSLCNLRCKHCFFGYDETNYSAKDDLTTEEIIKLIDYLVEKYEICAVNIMGKEPFMQKDILKIIKHIKKHNLYLRIQTNGTLITNNIKEQLFQILDKQNDTLHISIDGALQEVHDDIRGIGNFKKTKDIIKSFTELNYNVLLAYTINSINLPTTEFLYELCSELNVKSVLLGKYEDYIMPKAELIPCNEDIILNCAKLIQKTKENNTNIYYDLGFLTPEFILNFEAGESLLDKYLETNKQTKNLLKCHKSERIAVMSNGDVYLCPSCQTTNREFCLGNIKKQSFSDIWDNRYNDIFFNPREFKKSVCKVCKYNSICKGGCMVGTFFTYNTMDAPSANCNYYKKLEKIHGK